MTTRQFREYLNLSRELLRAQSQARHDEEDDLIDQLEDLWFQIDAASRPKLEERVRALMQDWQPDSTAVLRMTQETIEGEFTLIADSFETLSAYVELLDVSTTAYATAPFEVTTHPMAARSLVMQGTAAPKFQVEVAA